MAKTALSSRVLDDNLDLLMWQIDDQTPYATERNWVRDANGGHHWLVAVRATFDMDPPGDLSLADEQLPPVLAPEHFGAPGESSLRYDSDLLAIKPSTDVLLHGSAHAPKGSPAKTVRVVLRVGLIEKQLLVHGERVYYDGLAGLSTTDPKPFVTRPIRYELAFGGGDTSAPEPSRHAIDERNPVGRGHARRRANLVNAPAHSIEYGSGSPGSRAPAGFGPIEPGWLPRRLLAGTYDAAWVRSKKPLLPNDYDPAFALCSPADQRPPSWLQGGEPVGLLNLCPEGTLAFTLPRVALEVRSFFGRRARPHGPTRLVTVLFEPDDRRLSLVWQSSLPVAAPDVEHLDFTQVVEHSGKS